MSTQPRSLPEAIQRAVDGFAQDSRELGDHVHSITLTEVSLPAGQSTTIYHKLGRVPKGYWPVRVRVGTPAYFEVEEPNRSTIKLYSENSTIVDLVVF